MYYGPLQYIYWTYLPALKRNKGHLIERRTCLLLNLAKTLGDLTGELTGIGGAGSKGGGGGGRISDQLGRTLSLDRTVDCDEFGPNPFCKRGNDLESFVITVSTISKPTHLTAPTFFSVLLIEINYDDSAFHPQQQLSNCICLIALARASVLLSIEKNRLPKQYLKRTECFHQLRQFSPFIKFLLKYSMHFYDTRSVPFPNSK